jgi:hypothetical protein
MLCAPSELNSNEGENIVLVDTCIAPLVQMLNDYGVRTNCCCCGHGKRRSSIEIHTQSFSVGDYPDKRRVHLMFPYKAAKLGV